MSNIDKQAVQAVADLKAGYTLGHADVAILNELARIALASLEAEAVAYIRDGFRADGVHFCGGIITAEEHERTKPALSDRYNWKHQPLYTAPPVPVSVLDEKQSRELFEKWCSVNIERNKWHPEYYAHYPATGQWGAWEACRAAMLQGADGTLTNEGTIPVTQFKPVADLYGLTSPTGGETSFTFDAVEACDFIDGGWSCQEYVELGRFQEAVSGSSPAIPDGWVMVPEEPTHEMLEAGDEQFGTYDVYRRMIAAAPQQEVKP